MDQILRNILGVLRTIATFLGITAVCMILQTVLELLSLILSTVTGVFAIASEEDSFEEGQSGYKLLRTKPNSTWWNPFKSSREATPRNKSKIDWPALYPEYAVGDKMTKRVEVAALGHGSDDLLVNMAARMPDTLMTIFGVHRKSVERTQTRIAALRYENAIDVPIPNAVTYGNVAAILTNGIKTVPEYFSTYQLSKVILCFPPKKQIKHMSRHGINVAEAYACIVRPGGMLYMISNKEEATRLMHDELESSDDNAMWQLVPEESWKEDECVVAMGETWQTMRRGTHIAVWKRREVYV